MGYKNVCLNCRRVTNLGTNYKNFSTSDCPECSEKMFFITHLFKPPKKNNDKLWKVIIFLINKGFMFQHIYKVKKTENLNFKELVNYPTTISDAELFVEEYKEQAIDISKT